MKDIFDAKIICKTCDVEMKSHVIEKKGFALRAVKCQKCGDKIVHPSDLNNLNHYNAIRNKTYIVKLRVVGNSHAISIPKEIVNFFNETNREMRTQMDDMVKLAFEDFGKLSVSFINDDVKGKHGGESKW